VLNEQINNIDQEPAESTADPNLVPLETKRSMFTYVDKSNITQQRQYNKNYEIHMKKLKEIRELKQKQRQLSKHIIKINTSRNIQMKASKYKMRQGQEAIAKENFVLLNRLVDISLGPK
jgi:hypothetical protein